MHANSSLSHGHVSTTEFGGGQVMFVFIFSIEQEERGAVILFIVFFFF